MCLGRDEDANASRSLIFNSQELRKMWLFIQRLMGKLWNALMVGCCMAVKAGLMLHGGAWMIPVFYVDSKDRQSIMQP